MSGCSRIGHPSPCHIAATPVARFAAEISGLVFELRADSQKVDGLLSSTSTSAQRTLHIAVEGRGVFSSGEKYPPQRLGKDRPRGRP